MKKQTSTRGFSSGDEPQRECERGLFALPFWRFRPEETTKSIITRVVHVILPSKK